MTPLQSLTLVSAILGAAGSGVLFFNSYALEPSEGAVWGGPDVDAENARIARRNASRVFLQRIGLGLILAAFVLQGLSAFAPS